MLPRVLYLEGDLDMRPESGQTRAAKPVAGLEAEPVRGHVQLAHTVERRAAGGVRARAGELPPTFARTHAEEHSHAPRGQAARHVENVGRDAHPSPTSVRSFATLNRPILRSSAAATPISTSGSFTSRASQSASISSAVRPVAHTM